MNVPYKNNNTVHASAQKSVLGTYERLIEAVENGRDDEAQRILSGLRHSMNVARFPSFAVGMERIYRHCSALVRKGDEREEVLRILTHLRSVWELAFAEKGKINSSKD